MKNKMIVLFLLLMVNAMMFAQDTPDYDLKINIQDGQTNDSILILNVLFSNNSQKEIIIYNPKHNLIGIRQGENVFKIPPLWEFLIMRNNQEECFSEGHVLLVQRSAKNMTTIIKSNQTYSFQVPINMKRLYCMSDPDLNGDPDRKGLFEFQLKIGLIEPKDIDIESNKVTFELKKATNENTL